MSSSMFARLPGGTDMAVDERRPNSSSGGGPISRRLGHTSPVTLPRRRSLAPRASAEARFDLEIGRLRDGNVGVLAAELGELPGGELASGRRLVSSVFPEPGQDDPLGLLARLVGKELPPVLLALEP
jgi:hypothetical protein